MGLSRSRSRLLRVQDLSPATFAAEVAGSLEHRIATSVVVPATNRALRRLRTAAHESWFWSTDNYAQPVEGVRATSTFSLKIGSFS